MQDTERVQHSPPTLAYATPSRRRRRGSLLQANLVGVIGMFFWLIGIACMANGILDYFPSQGTVVVSSATTLVGLGGGMCCLAFGLCRLMRKLAEGR